MGRAMFIRLVKLQEQVRRRYDVSSLSWIIHTGALCPPESRIDGLVGAGDRRIEFAYTGDESEVIMAIFNGIDFSILVLVDHHAALRRGLYFHMLEKVLWLDLVEV